MPGEPVDDGLNAWRRAELVWTLRWLAAEPEATVRAVRGAVTADEIALDVRDWHEIAAQWGLLDDEPAAAIKAIDDAFAAMSDVGHLWTDEAILHAQEWESQRQRARYVLALMGETRADADLGRPREGGPRYVTDRGRSAS